MGREEPDRRGRIMEFTVKKIAEKCSVTPRAIRNYCQKERLGTIRGRERIIAEHEARLIFRHYSANAALEELNTAIKEPQTENAEPFAENAEQLQISSSEAQNAFIEELQAEIAELRQDKRYLQEQNQDLQEQNRQLTASVQSLTESNKALAAANAVQIAADKKPMLIEESDETTPKEEPKKKSWFSRLFG